MKSNSKSAAENPKKLVLLIGIPLLLILSLALLFGKTKQRSGVEQFPVEEEEIDEVEEFQPEETTDDLDTLPEESLEQFPAEPAQGGLSRAKVAVPTGFQIVNPSDEEIRARLEEIRNLAPVNPDQVVAKASRAPNAEELIQGQPYQYPNPVFTWSGAKVKEPGVKITGYMVYFGESHFSPDFLNEAKFQAGNTYTASNLVLGKNYYLMVRVVTDSQKPSLMYGFDPQADGRPVRPLFMYNYR